MKRKNFVGLLLLVSQILNFQYISFAQTITKGPYLISVAERSITIRWEVDALSEGGLYYGLDKSLNQNQKAHLRGIKEDHYLYEVNLNNLSPLTYYYYQVRVGKTNSSTSMFKTTSSTDKEFSFVAMGDSRSNPVIFQAISDQVNTMNPDFIISMGDLVENGGTFQQWGEFYFNVVDKVINHIPLISTLGDHEGDGDDGDLFRHYLLNDESVGEQWFSYDMGDAHFVSLDYRHPKNEKMIEWFTKDMDSCKTKWRFVYMHRPCYNLGGHRSAWGKGIWPELFRKYKIDIVFAGHSHQYERFYPIRPIDDSESWPVTYITTGGAGAGLYEVTQHPYLAKAQSVNHFMYIKVKDDTLNSTTYLNDGSTLDNFKFIKNDRGYNKEYLAQVKPQDYLNVLSMFTRAISFSIGEIPMDRYPASANIELVSYLDNEDIPFEITLAPESVKYYRVEPIKGILGKGQTLNIPVKIFNKGGDLTFSGWGSMNPELRLIAKYSTSESSEEIIGSTIDYWPDNDY